MKKSLITAAAAAALSLSLSIAPASAKDWIESVSVARDGIDVAPIEVRPGSNAYASIKTANHKFSLRLSARATNGERIVAMKVAMFNGVEFFENSGNSWNLSFSGSAVGNGANRTVGLSIDPVIGINHINWKGKDPVQACNAVLNQKLAKGYTHASALAQTWDTTVDVFFQLDAVAAHKNKSQNGKWNIGNTEHERASGSYRVNVRCLAKPARAGF